MSESLGRSSSTSSISLLEIKAETHLVLQAFLHHTLSIPPRDRPGTVGGVYKDHNIYSTRTKSKDSSNSQAEDVTSADEKKNSFRGLIKQLSRRNNAFQIAKDPSSPSTKDLKLPVSSARQLKEDGLASPDSTSDEDGELATEKKQKKLDKRKIGKKLSRFFKRRLEKEEKEKQLPDPHRLPIQTDELQPRPSSSHKSDDATSEKTLRIHVSPAADHPPGFYCEVAEKLDKIAQNSTGSLTRSLPLSRAPPVSDKESVVQKLVQILSSEGDAINTKIHSDPFLRSSLARLSYPSFSKLLDTFGNFQMSQPEPLPPAASPTLQRVAVTMEVSRRIVNAVGTRRMEGYAECYMDNFAPWVKRNGGWANIVEHLEESQEYD